MTAARRYVALLRGVNVGGKNPVSMAGLVETFRRLGFADARTFINSGNVVFSAAERSDSALRARIEGAIEKDIGLQLDVLVLRDSDLARIVEAIPPDWVNDSVMRCDVMLLWKDVDDPAVLDRLPTNPEIDNVLYVPGAVVWRIDRTNATRSRLTRIIGSPLYKRMTIRNSNTIRRLHQLLAG